MLLWMPCWRKLEYATHGRRVQSSSSRSTVATSDFIGRRSLANCDDFTPRIGRVRLLYVDPISHSGRVNWRNGRQWAARRMLCRSDIAVCGRLIQTDAAWTDPSDRMLLRVLTTLSWILPCIDRFELWTSSNLHNNLSSSIVKETRRCNRFKWWTIGKWCDVNYEMFTGRCCMVAQLWHSSTVCGRLRYLTKCEWTRKYTWRKSVAAGIWLRRVENEWVWRR